MKRKRKESDSEESSDIKPHPSAGRSYTVSLALPGSIIENAQSAELRTYLAGQVARAAAVFNVDEVIVFNEQGRLRYVMLISYPVQSSLVPRCLY